MFLTHCSSTDTTALFVSDRNVTALNIPELDTAHLKQVPSSQSGWQLTWNPPLTPGGWLRTYVFFDSLNQDDQGKLRNGGVLGQAFSTPFEVVDSQATSYEIPTRVLRDNSPACDSGCRGKEAPTTRAWFFTVWAQYGEGDIGQPIRYRFFLGDEYPPQLPAIQRTIGADTALFAWDSVLDQTGRYALPRPGNLSQLRWKLWRGLFQRDSARIRLRQDSVRRIDGVGHAWVTAFPDETNLAGTAWSDSATDSALVNAASFRLHVRGLRAFRPYTLVLQFTDRSGASRTSTSTSTPQQFSTHDSLAPAGIDTVTVRPDSSRPTNAAFLFAAPCDTFGPGTSPLRAAFPNRGIQKIVAQLHSRRVDSVTIPGDSTVGLRQPWESRNWAWSGTTWTWTWTSLQPGEADSVRFEVTDQSGNLQQRPSPWTSFRTPLAPAVRNLACPTGYVAVGKGSTSVGGRPDSTEAFCIEAWPHADAAGRLIDTLPGLPGLCPEDAQLCTETQWQRACEGEGDSTRLNFGVTGLLGTDTLAQLQDRCGLFSGDSLRLWTRDARCLSPWGVHGMAGPVFEVVAGQFSDTALAGIHVLKGGTWLVPTAPSAALASVGCRSRNYPSFSDSVLIGGLRRPRPRSGLTRNIGYRCCRPPQAAAGRASLRP